MRQLHVKEPWAGLAYSTEREIISDLLSRIQVLEHRLRELEEMVKHLEVVQVSEQESLPFELAGS